MDSSSNSLDAKTSLRTFWISARVLFAGFLAVAVIFGSGCHRSLTFSNLIGLIGASTTSTVNQEPQEGRPGNLEWDQNPKAPATDLAKDWDKPNVALFISGRQHGYIEPCGCTGLENQKGGMMRRHTAQKVLLDRGWDVISIDAGNQVRRFGEQPVIKLRKTYECLCRILNYDVIGFGPDDMKIPDENLGQTMLDSLKDDNIPFTSANVVVLDESLSNRYRVIERGGMKIGVTTILGEEHIKKLLARGVEGVQMPQAVLPQVLKGMFAARCDMRIIVAQTAPENCRKLAKLFPDFNIMINAGDAGDPTMRPEILDHGNGKSTAMIQCGVKGMYVGVVGIYRGANGPTIKYQRVPLDARFKDSPPVQAAFASYQRELESRWKGGTLKDIAPKPHPTDWTYVGSEACSECHLDEFQIWEDSPHFKATEDIVDPPERGGVPRHWDPECASCHTTGWHPQDYYPYKTGLQMVEDKKFEALHGSGCENCHQPGSAHVAIQKLVNKKGGIAALTPEENAQRKMINSKIWLSKKTAKESHCQTCHDLDNSPDFFKDGAFEEYWEQIEHGNSVRGDDEPGAERGK